MPRLSDDQRAILEDIEADCRGYDLDESEAMDDHDRMLAELEADLPPAERCYPEPEEIGYGADGEFPW